MNVPGKIAVLACLLTFVAAGLVTAPAAEEWKAPAEAAQVKNPVPKAPESLARGKRLYLRYCMNCHGISGKGDGPESAGLDPPPGNFAESKQISAETDGELFWKLTEGKGKMKPYAEVSSTHTDQEKWDLVNYIRTLAGEKVSENDPASPPDKFVAHYLNITLALSKNDLAATRKSAAALGALAERKLLGEVEKKKEAETERLAKNLRQSAALINKTEDLNTARQAFADVSKTMNDWLSLTQYRYQTALTVYRCPQGPDSKPVIWIQKPGDVLNPYQVKGKESSNILRKIERREMAKPAIR